MRRRKKDKALEKPQASVSEDALENSGRGRSTKADALSRSPPQQRKRSLLGLSSMRDLVEQVQDSLTYKTKQQDPPVTASTLGSGGGGSTHSSVEKSSRHGASAGSGLSAPASPASLATATAAPAAVVGSTEIGAISTTNANTAFAAPKKKVLDLKLLPSGTSLTLRTKKQTQFTPSPSEFRARERPDAVEHQPFCGVCAAPFTLMVRRQRCQVCGESVCAQCSSDKRYVEGQKGLQRVCDICIVEGPVVLDDNGMYVAGPSPVATSIVPPYPTPRSASSTYNFNSSGRPPTQTHAPLPPSNASALYNSATSSKPRGGKDSMDHATAVRILFTEDDAAPKSTTTRTTTTPIAGGAGGRSRTPSRGGCSGSRTPNGGSGGARTPSRSGGGASSRCGVRPPKSPSACGRHVCTPSRGQGSNGGSERETDKAAADADAAAALGEDDDGDTEGGHTSSVTSSKPRKRSKKARRLGTAATELAKPSSDKKQFFWSAGQGIGDLLGISSSSGGGGGRANTPVSRSRSTPRSANAGGSSNSTSAGSAIHGGSVVGDGCSTGNIGTNDTASGGGSKGKWESISKRRPPGGGKGQAVVGNGSAFIRDFIRGAGIYRLNPRRLAGPLVLCASRTGLDKIFGGVWILLLWLLEVEGEPTRGGAGGARSKRSGGGRGGHGYYYSNAHNNHQYNGSAGGRGWRPGRRFVFLASLVLLASYRRYQVTHPELTTEHVLGAASSLLIALVSFMAHAITDLARDACGAVIPSLCGTRESRLAAALGRDSSDWIRSHEEVIAGVRFTLEGGSSGGGNRNAESGDGEVSDGGNSDSGSGAIASGDGEVSSDGNTDGESGAIESGYYEVSGGGNSDGEVSDDGNSDGGSGAIASGDGEVSGGGNSDSESGAIASGYYEVSGGGNSDGEVSDDGNSDGGSGAIASGDGESDTGDAVEVIGTKDQIEGHELDQYFFL